MTDDRHDTTNLTCGGMEDNLLLCRPRLLAENQNCGLMNATVETGRRAGVNLAESSCALPRRGGSSLSGRRNLLRDPVGRHMVLYTAPPCTLDQYQKNLSVLIIHW